MEHRLIIQFNNRKKALLFNGQSWLRKKLADEISIYHDRIILSFDRKKAVNLQSCLFSQKSLFRYEIQKALCFYLAVTGMLPKVKEIILERKDNKQMLEDMSFTDKWHKCKVSRRLEVASASRVFGEGSEAKAAYIALTYYLKAQLDHFSHDCFRAAWSGLNVLYTALAPDGADSEWQKINALKECFDNNTLEDTWEYTRGLDEKFWNKLDWYSYTRGFCSDKSGKIKPIDKVKQSLFDLQDTMLISKVADYMRAVVYTGKEGNYGKQSDYQRSHKQIETSIKNSSVSYSARARFLVAEYCYMVRNRSFHAEKAYPLFTFDNKAGTSEKTVEEILTELVLLTIEGLMREL